MNTFAPELLGVIFSFADKKTVFLTCSRVCKKWCKISFLAYNKEIEAQSEKWKQFVYSYKPFFLVLFPAKTFSLVQTSELNKEEMEKTMSRHNFLLFRNHINQMLKFMYFAQELQWLMLWFLENFDSVHAKVLFQKEAPAPKKLLQRTPSGNNTVQEDVSALYGSDYPSERATILTKYMDSLIVLDYLKAWQAGLINDLAMYKRFVSQYARHLADTKTRMTEVEAEETEGRKDALFELTVFLREVMAITKGLRQKLEPSKNFVSLISEVIQYCTERLKVMDQAPASTTTTSPTGGSTTTNPEEEQIARVLSLSVCLSDNILYENKEKPASATLLKKLTASSQTLKPKVKIGLYKELTLNVPYTLEKCAPNFFQKEIKEKEKNAGCTIL